MKKSARGAFPVNGFAVCFGVYNIKHFGRDDEPGRSKQLGCRKQPELYHKAAAKQI
jgi:hypothetical protein